MISNVNYNYNKNQVSFGSKKLFPVYVKEIDTGKKLKAWFSRLSPDVDEDKEAIEKIGNSWGKKPGVTCSDHICRRFKDGFPTYAIEFENYKNKKLHEKILCLASINNKNLKEEFRLAFLQASPESTYNARPGERTCKYAGTALMYGLVRFAKRLNSERFELSSVAKFFYNNLQMPTRDGVRCFLPTEMNEFLKRLRPKVHRSIETHSGSDSIELKNYFKSLGFIADRHKEQWRHKEPQRFKHKERLEYKQQEPEEKLLKQNKSPHDLRGAISEFKKFKDLSIP